MKKAVQITAEGKSVVLDLDSPEGELAVLQRAVDGYIEPVSLTERFDMYVNEEGLFRNDLGLNRWALEMTGVTIRGAVVLAGNIDNEGEITGLTDEEVSRFLI